jgi:glyoxylase-like metal-dependent hydrolase (beta-lactamase superfamily II)
VDPEELKAASSPLAMMEGYVKGHREGVALRPIAYAKGLGPFDQVCDLLGDGSLHILKTAGHTAGNIAAFLNLAGGPILLTFDAVHRGANLVEMIPPKGDYERALSSLGRIKSFLEENPGTKVIYGHDPDQLGELKLAPEAYT